MSEQGRRARRKARPRVTVVGVLGELLLTGGVLVLLFLGWQLWWNDMIMANSQKDAAGSQSEEWLKQANPPSEPPASDEPVDYGPPLVRAAPVKDAPFAVLFIPRFGEDYKRVVAEGTTKSVLNSADSGIGHYPGTQMPGEIGNFAIAAHRSANGGGMHLINEFQLNDPIYVQTEDGWYTYRYRDLEYVSPDTVSVIAPVPRHEGAVPTQSFITLTSCNPLLSTDERIIAYGILESWQPASAGPPAGAAEFIAAQGG